jgi:nicotinate-nucleotide adenylyltransferase
VASIGFLGGTFNPIHIGHVRLAIEALEQLGLDRVELLPSSIPPHRSDPDMLPFGIRYELVRLAVQGAENIAANPIESARPGPSFTVDTLAELQKLMPDDELWFIMGAGEFTALGAWRKGLQIPAMANLAVADRGGTIAGAEAFLKHQWPGAEQVGLHRWKNPAGKLIAMFSVPVIELCASDIRGKWRRGDSIHGLVDVRVEAEIKQRSAEIDAAWSHVPEDQPQGRSCI